MIGKSLFFIFIQPLVLLIELIFTIMSRVSQNAGIAIVMVSVVINLLILPLYKRSDIMQERARDTEEKIQEGVKHIKKAFSGDELGAVTRYPVSGSRIIVERKKREAPSSAGYIPARYSLSELYR